MGWGGYFGGPQAQSAARDAGLPHAGVPGNLRVQVEEVLRKEPEYPPVNIDFSHRQPADPPLTLAHDAVAVPPPAGRGAAVGGCRVGHDAIGPLCWPRSVSTSGVRSGNVRVLLVVAAVFLSTVVAHAFSSSLRIRYTGKLGERLMYALRMRVFSHYQRLSLDFFTREKAGVLMTRMTSDIEALTVLFQEGLVNFAVQSLVLLVITGVLFYLNPLLAVLTLVIVVPGTFLLSIWFRRVSNLYYGLVRDRIADVLADLQESLAGIRVITAHNRRRHNVVHHNNVVGRHKDANLAGVKAASIYAPTTEAIVIIGQALLVVIGGTMVINGSLTPGELTAFVLYLTFFFAPIQQLVQLYNGYQQGQASAKKLREVLMNEPSVHGGFRCRGSAPHRGRDHPRPGELRLRGRHPGAARREPARWRRARAWRWWGPPGRASPRWPSSSPGSTTPSRERSASTAVTCAR